MENSKNIMVSVSCLVYNHEPFLRECFDGFVMQQTTFPIEILVHDDASTDHSADIIREYTEKYPDLFKPIFQTENQYSKGVKINMEYQIPRAKGKYIAMCEGDDYWTDPLKLQKQVDFLEEHEEYVLSFHDAMIVDAEGNLISESKIKLYLTESMCRDWSEYELMCGHIPPTPSVVYRKEYYLMVSHELNNIKNRKNIINGDLLINSCIGKYGKGKFHKDIASSVCRVHAGGVWQMKPNLYKQIHAFKAYSFIRELHKRNIEVKKNIDQRRFFYLCEIIKLCDIEKNIKSFWTYYMALIGLSITTSEIKYLRSTNKYICGVAKFKIRNAKNLKYMRKFIKKVKSIFKRKKCPICGNSFDEYLEMGTVSDVWKKYGAVGAGIRKAICPICHSSDRERLVYLFFRDYYFIGNKDKHVKFLHIAPEANLSKYLITYPNVEYIAGDKRCEGYSYPEYVRDIDIMDLHDISDNTYDVVVCNHVLEHVPDDIVAMKELRRVLKHDGIAVLQVPYALKLERTFEDKSIGAPDARFFAYGQDDHVRLYGMDYPERLKVAGFNVEVIDIVKKYPKKYGLNPNEKLFLCRK